MAFSLELSIVVNGRELLTYRDSVTSGFIVRLGTGEDARVPAGRLRFAGTTPEVIDVDNLELEAYLRAIDPARNDSETRPPIRFNMVRESVLFSGDRADVWGKFLPVVGERQSTLYRDAPSTYLHCQGIADVRRIL